MSSTTLLTGALWYSAFLLSIILHEAAHAWAAHRSGDSTAYLGGQVSLNPLPHILREPVGTVVIPLISFALSGWMIGWASAPFNRAWAFRYPKRLGAMSLAGPAANLALVVVAGLTLRAGLEAGLFLPATTPGFSQLVDAGPNWCYGPAIYLSILFSLNLILFAFNLMPVPPLDGCTALTLALPESTARQYLNVIHQPPLMILGIVIAWNAFDYVIAPVFRSALTMLYGG